MVSLSYKYSDEPASWKRRDQEEGLAAPSPRDSICVQETELPLNSDGDTGPPGSSSALAPRAGSAGPLSPRYTSAGCTALSTRTWSTADTLSFLLAYREEHASRRVTQKSSDSHAAHRRRLPSRAFPCLGHFPQRTAARSLLTSSDLCGLQASSGIRPHTGDAQEPLAACPTPGFQAAQVPAALTLAPHQLPGAQRKQPARRGNARGLEMRAAGGCFLPPRPRVGKQHLGGRAGGGGGTDVDSGSGPPEPPAMHMLMAPRGTGLLIIPTGGTRCNGGASPLLPTPMGFLPAGGSSPLSLPGAGIDSRCCSP